MRPTVRNEIVNLPRALRETIERARREYDPIIRTTHWGDSPVTFAASAAKLPLAEFMASAFGSLLGWPCVVQHAAEAVTTIRPKSIWFLIPERGESSELLPLAQAVRSQHAIALALVGENTDPLAQAVDGAFVVNLGETLGRIGLPIGEQAMAGYLPLLVARTLKRPVPRFETLEKEFAQLPGHLEKAFAQHADGVRSLAAELGRAKNLTIIAGGSYYCAAAGSAELLSQFAGIATSLHRVTEDSPSTRLALDPGASVLVLTGARCPLKKQTLVTVKTANRAGAKVLTLTDGNDPEVARQSAMTLLLPPLDEITGAILTHAVMAWTVYEASRLSLVGRRPAK